MWFPVQVRVVATDYILNKFETPAMAAQACTRPLYQSTPLSVLADFGGEGLEPIVDVDISGISTLSSSDTTLIQISNGIAQV